MRAFGHSRSGDFSLAGLFSVKTAAFLAAVAAVAFLFLVGPLPARAPQAQAQEKALEDSPKLCRYSTWEWNTRTRKSVNHRWVNKPFGEIAKEERDPASRCSVCEADQIRIKLEGIPEFRICKYFAKKVKAAVLEMQRAGFPIQTVIGYRVGRSRGKPDAEGLRTRFSNHSFGTAIDINAALNGMYSNCVVFGQACRLIRGGPWRQEIPGTLLADSIAVRALKAIGWKWGGEIAGRQKDFMHFSLSGY